jgi:hypothetical protein
MTGERMKEGGLGHNHLSKILTRVCCKSRSNQSNKEFTPELFSK